MAEPPPVEDSREGGQQLCSIQARGQEWRRGPRLREEVPAQQALFPGPEAVPFGPLVRDFADIPGLSLYPG